MKEITYEFFKRVCPSGTTPDNRIFLRLQDAIRQATEDVESVTTREILDSADAVEYDPAEQPESDIETVIHSAAHLICIYAYYSAIPQLDLVLTNTGFGVVSTQDMVPASADRVRSLRRALAESMVRWYDSLVTALTKFEQWSESPAARNCIASLFYKIGHMRLLGIASPSWSDFRENMPEIFASEREIRKIISCRLFEQLLTALRSASATAVQRSLIDLCRRFSVRYLKHTGECWEVKREILVFLEENLSDFPAYASSSERQANNHVRYENRKDDPSFFFG